MSNGQCYNCNESLSLAQMKKHLSKCTKSNPKENQAFLIKVKSRQPGFWLFLKVNQNCTFDALDDCLRDVWLECCGHLSHFIIDDVYYEKTMGDGFVDGFDADAETMKVKVKDVLESGMQFFYEYDYGSTTELKLEVKSTINNPDVKQDVMVLARNNAFRIDCNSCGNVAVSICELCMYDGKGFLCKSCAKKHDCENGGDESSILPVVNSPRMGVCAYVG